jgi:hypothetical protein
MKFSVQYTMSNLINNLFLFLFLFMFIIVLHSCSRSVPFPLQSRPDLPAVHLSTGAQEISWPLHASTPILCLSTGRPPALSSHPPQSATARRHPPCRQPGPGAAIAILRFVFMPLLFAQSNIFVEGVSHKIRRQIEDPERAGGVESSLKYVGVHGAWKVYSHSMRGKIGSQMWRRRAEEAFHRIAQEGPKCIKQVHTFAQEEGGQKGGTPALFLHN